MCSACCDHVSGYVVRNGNPLSCMSELLSRKLHLLSKPLFLDVGPMGATGIASETSPKFQ